MVHQLLLLLLTSSVMCLGFKTNISSILKPFLFHLGDRERVIPKTAMGEMVRSNVKDAFKNDPDGGVPEREEVETTINVTETAEVTTEQQKEDKENEENDDTDNKEANETTEEKNGKNKDDPGKNSKRARQKELNKGEEDDRPKRPSRHMENLDVAAKKPERKRRGKLCPKKSLSSVCLKKKMSSMERQLRESQQTEKEAHMARDKIIDQLKEETDALKNALLVMSADFEDFTKNETMQLADTIETLNKTLTRMEERNNDLEAKVAGLEERLENALQAVSEQNSTVVSQQKVIDLLVRDNKSLETRVKRMENATRTRRRARRKTVY